VTERVEDHFDVIVMGAGPAGSVAAMLAAQRGWRVLLVDRQPFPRRKVCGGCLSSAATTRLSRCLGAECMPGVTQRVVTFITRRGRRLSHRSDGRARVVMRDVLDSRLLMAARSAGAEVRLGVTAKPAPSSSGWGVWLGSNRVSTRAVFQAGGVAALAAPARESAGMRRGGMVGWQWTQPAPTPDLAVGDVEMHWLTGGYIGVTCVEPGRWNVAMAVDDAKGAGPAAFGPAATSVARLRHANPSAAVWERLSASIAAGDWPRAYVARGVAGFPARPRTLGDQNLLRIGDAAGYSEPFAGDGMNLAMLSAELAIEACDRAGVIEGRHPLTSERLSSTYTALMRRWHEPLMARTQWLGRFLRRPWLDRIDQSLPDGWPSKLLANLVGCVHAGGRRSGEANGGAA